MPDPLKIHLVDDDPDFVAAASALLREAGHHVTATTASTQAVVDVERERPDCVLLDIMMPGVDGFQVCRSLRGRESLRDTRIIMVTAKAYAFDRERAMGFGADGYITKPIQRESFLRDVQRIAADELHLTFWGVRGTLPVPGPESIRYGGNTNCVSLSFPDGRLFVFDAGTGIKALSNHLMGTGQTRLEARIFISHPHWDHINGLPFFVPLYLQGNEFEILSASQGDLSVREMISAQMDNVYFPITIREFAARVYFRDLEEGSYDVDGVEVQTLLLSHPGSCLGYRVSYGGRSVCYVTDNELYLPGSPHHNPEFERRLTRFMAGADVAIVDCTYTDESYPAKVGWGHSSVTQCVRSGHEAGVGDLYLHHHDPDDTDADIDAKLAVAEKLLADLGSKTRARAPVEGELIRV